MSSKSLKDKKSYGIRKEMTPLSYFLSGTFQKLGMKSEQDRFQLEQLIRQWIGDKASNAFNRFHLKSRKLILEFNHPILLQEMMFRKQQGLRLFQQKFPELNIQQVEFRIASGRK
jgi:hypothetical protein